MTQDRRALRRAYLETRHPAGVYRVLNVPDGRVLLARSLNLPASLNRERAQLQFRGHPNAALQRDWLALGAEAFQFDVLDTLEQRDDDTPQRINDELAVLEALWRERFQSAGLTEYNNGLTSGV
jgi:hypothetical protein